MSISKHIVKKYDYQKEEIMAYFQLAAFVAKAQQTNDFNQAVIFANVFTDNLKNTLKTSDKEGWTDDEKNAAMKRNGTLTGLKLIKEIRNDDVEHFDELLLAYCSKIKSDNLKALTMKGFVQNIGLHSMTTKDTIAKKHLLKCKEIMADACVRYNFDILKTFKDELYPNNEINDFELSFEENAYKKVKIEQSETLEDYQKLKEGFLLDHSTNKEILRFVIDQTYHYDGFIVQNTIDNLTDIIAFATNEQDFIEKLAHTCLNAYKKGTLEQELKSQKMIDTISKIKEIVDNNELSKIDNKQEFKQDFEIKRKHNRRYSPSF